VELSAFYIMAHSRRPWSPSWTLFPIGVDGSSITLLRRAATAMF